MTFRAWLATPTSLAFLCGLQHNGRLAFKCGQKHYGRLAFLRATASSRALKFLKGSYREIFSGKVHSVQYFRHMCQNSDLIRFFLG
uniref:Secreted protein n=1 Tax=Hordeum vulgare subsp. vulgare TaxID=112509 RepID=A0A8I6XUY5_HORVV